MDFPPLDIDSFFACAVALAVLAPAWIAAWRQADAWPFSYYPMFSTPQTPEKLIVHRVAIEGPDGARRWWRPHFYKLQQFFGRQFSRAAGLAPARRHTAVIRLFDNIAACLPDDSGLANSAATICVVERGVKRDVSGSWISVDRVIARRAQAASPGPGI